MTADVDLELISEGEEGRFCLYLSGNYAELLLTDFSATFEDLGEVLAEAMRACGVSTREVRFGRLHGGFAMRIAEDTAPGPGLLEGVGWVIPEELLRPVFVYSPEGLPLQLAPGAGLDLIEREFGSAAAWMFAPRRSVLSFVRLPSRPPVQVLCQLLERYQWDLALSEDKNMRHLASVVTGIARSPDMHELLKSTSSEGFQLVASGLRQLLPLMHQCDSERVDRWSRQ